MSYSDCKYSSYARQHLAQRVFHARSACNSLPTLEVGGILQIASQRVVDLLVVLARRADDLVQLYIVSLSAWPSLALSRASDHRVIWRREIEVGAVPVQNCSSFSTVYCTPFSSSIFDQDLLSAPAHACCRAAVSQVNVQEAQEVGSCTPLVTKQQAILGSPLQWPE